VKLLALGCESFRNLAKVELVPAARATVVVGENGQGKTNLLEALYFLATLKPLRASKLAELVRFGQSSARVWGRFRLKGAEREISVEVRDGVRVAAVDGKPTRELTDYFGGVSVVAFTPDDLQVVKGSPDGRRAFLDRAVFNRWPAYLKESREYARALKSRNRLLKDRAPRAHLHAWDATVAQAGARLWLRRRALVAEVQPRAEKAFERIGRTEGAVAWTYLPAQVEAAAFAAADEQALRAMLAAGLEAQLPRDLERGHTSVGPSVDDLSISLADHAARAFASQGQSRALVLAWKVAEIENLHAVSGVLPLLLLDDVSSELDPQRNAFLMDYLKDSGAQVLLTTTDLKLVQRAAEVDSAWFRMEQGRVTSISAPLAQPPQQ
jgi:DNA replication and repair protein RecF